MGKFRQYLTELSVLGAIMVGYFIEVPVFDANSVDSDQTSNYVVSDLSLHFLPKFLL